jgi:CHAT domain-containing protein/predicted negative regulator of RcsB-dependent stress response
MSKASRVACLVLIFAGVGSVQRTGPALTKALTEPSSNSLQKAELRRVYKLAYTLTTEGRYLQAQDLFRKILMQFKASGDLQMAGRCLTSVGNTQFSMFQYRAALDSYLRARTFAEAGRDRANLATLNLNISSLLLQMGDLDAAAHTVESALADYQKKDFPGGKTHCLIQLGIIRARQGDMAQSAARMREAVDSAYSEGDLSTVADAWDHLGEAYLSHRDLPSAEAALTEAFRVRTLHRLTHLTNSYFNLGRLRLAQRDLRSAAVLLDEAISRQQHHPDSWTNPWSLYHARGQAHMAAGEGRAAFTDYQKALELAREWRLEVLPTDFTRISSEGDLQEIYSSFIESANQLYLASGSRSELAAESFRAAEENRGASLHALLREPKDWRAALPDEYWQTLAQLHNTEVSLLQQDDVRVRQNMQHLRSQLLLAEAKAGSNVELISDKLLNRVQENLPPDAALLSFHLGERQSFLWAVSRERFRLYALPDRSHLTGGINDFVEAVRTRQDSATHLGRELYEDLFGRLAASFREKPKWILALDEQLFRIPFGALVVDSGGPVYLAERHAVRVTTGAVALVEGHHRTWNQLLSGRFLGVGDAIYNTADPRWREPQRERVDSFPGVVFAASENPRRQGWALARLPGSAREIESSARAWDAPSSILLEGPDAAPAPLRKALQTEPSIVHIAAHFLQGSTPPRHSLITLSLSQPGDLQMLSPLEITRFNFNAGVVVLSGCSSGRADVLPASGLMGLTRAWLAGGARAVVASHWPTPDDSGPLFVSFYQHLHQTPEAGPAAALQGAQREILRAGGWRSNPQYWATYFVVGD